MFEASITSKVIKICMVNTNFSSTDATPYYILIIILVKTNNIEQTMNKKKFFYNQFVTTNTSIRRVNKK